MKIPVGISARHMHINKETYEKLFGKNELEKFKDLNQPGEFASVDQVTIKSEFEEISNVRILGPFRNYNQVEISKSDARKLKLNPPVRRSGELAAAEKITIVGPLCEVELDEALIIANRHFHITKDMATNLGINNQDKFIVTIDGDKKGQIEVEAKILEEAFFEVHVDTDDANAFLLEQDEEVEINILKLT